MKALRGLIMEKDSDVVSVGRVSFWLFAAAVLFVLLVQERELPGSLEGIFYSLLVYNTATKGVSIFRRTKELEVSNDASST